MKEDLCIFFIAEFTNWNAFNCCAKKISKDDAPKLKIVLITLLNTCYEIQNYPPGLFFICSFIGFKVQKGQYEPGF